VRCRTVGKRTRWRRHLPALADAEALSCLRAGTNVAVQPLLRREHNTLPNYLLGVYAHAACAFTASLLNSCTNKTQLTTTDCRHHTTFVFDDSGRVYNTPYMYFSEFRFPRNRP